jgi:alpha-D-ribose 1-methylphosphonate 5-triphosphate synthase subunit PhnH
MTIDRPGFADPVLDAQASFRALLGAMSRPGFPHRVAGPADPPLPLGPATASVLLTLLDADTPLWVDATFAECLDWIVFHTGAPVVDLTVGARFALAATLPDLGAFVAGGDASPEDSATLIIQVAAIGTDLTGGLRMRLAGPGLRDPRTVCVVGLADDFVARWAANHALFPRGLDIVLCAGDDLVALPRSVRITEG